MAYDVDIVRRTGEAFFDLRAFGAGRPFLQFLALPAPLQPNSALVTDSACVYWLGERHWLLKVPTQIEAIWTERSESLGGALGSLTCVTDVYAGFDLHGPDAHAVLAQATPLDLRLPACPIGSATFTEVFGQTGLLHRTGEARFLLYVERSYADFIAAWLMAARRGRLPEDAALRA